MEIVAMTAADAAAKAQVHAIAWQHTYQPFLGQKKITFNEEKRVLMLQVTGHTPF